MKYQLEDAQNDINCSVNIFMSASDQLKEAYARLEAGRKHNEMTITHFLHLSHPRFLELDAKWVDALLEAERDYDDFGDFNDLNSLALLFKSKKLDDFDFGCKRFQALLQRQQEWSDQEDQTILMILCQYNPHLLN